ncbi:MAG: ATP-binding cassette domain-containing protein [Planctomycetes bacterium]|nr:ATP-binding cassette domain-containing protein [Planctomycetota bacterium]
MTTPTPTPAAPTEQPQAPVDTGAALRWLARLALPYRLRLLLALASMLATGAAGLVVPKFAGKAVDAVLLERSVDGLRIWILGLIGLYVGVAALDYLEAYWLRSAAAQILRDLRERLHAHLLKLSPAFYERERVGELISRMSADVGSVGEVLTGSVVSAAQQGLVLIGALALMVHTNAALTGVMLLAIPPIAIAAVLFGARFERMSKERQERLAESTVAAEESLAGIRTVQSFVREGDERARYGRSLDQVLRLSLRLAHLWGAYQALVSMLAFCAITLVIWYGASLLLENELTPGELMSFVLYTVSAGTAIASITHVWGGLKSAAGATQRVRELLETAPQVAESVQPRELGAARSFEFDQVSFAYASKPEVRAIDNLSLRAAPGDVIALVGPSGGGKTTLASLLLRFYDPTQGRVLLDGVDLRELRLADLRSALGYVSQEVFLFGGSVAENLRYGKPEATLEELRAAARAAHALEFVEALPQGFDTLLGERGVRLSTGERQRLAIARVLLKDPRIVVLDEATSALDAQSEHAVGQAFERLLEGRTTLVIAHRLATVRRATRVVVLEAGRCVESGTHDELLASSGLYRRLCELQMLV